jgi:hypothetical protein
MVWVAEVEWSAWPPALGCTRPPVQWAPRTILPGAKVAEA